jgi:DNA-binding protein YbaB
MKEMQELMKNPEDVQKWMAERKAEFDALPHT